MQSSVLSAKKKHRNGNSGLAIVASSACVPGAYEDMTNSKLN